MSFGTYLYTRLYYNHKTYNHKNDVKDDIELNNNAIEYIKKQIIQYSLMTEPNKMLPEEGRNDPSNYIINNIEELFSELTNIVEETYKLQLLYDQWEKCHDKESGCAISPPKEFESKIAYLDGDFINTIKNINNK